MDEGQVWEKTDSRQMKTAEDILGKPKTTEDKGQKTETGTDENNRGHFRTFEGR